MKQDMHRALESIVEDRFGPNSGRAFDKLKRITKYNQTEKRDGGFMQRAIAPDGRIVSGDTLEGIVMEHYRGVHNTVPDNPPEKFPNIRVSQEMLVSMMKNVKRNKGLAFDGIHDEMFRVGKDCRKATEYCQVCRKKLEFAAKLMSKEYWETEGSRRHLQGRLVAMNKKHPRMP